jgi:hypothetical protein
MEYKIEASKRNTKYIEALLPSMLKQLNLESSKKVLLIRVADECGTNQGITMDLGKNIGIVVVIKPRRNLHQIGLTLAHEMVHVKQLAKGTLKTRKTGSFIWSGKRYGKKTEYLSMPWEIEAFSKQELILRRAYQA